MSSTGLDKLYSLDVVHEAGRALVAAKQEQQQQQRQQPIAALIATEIARTESVRALQEQLGVLCGESGVPVPRQVFQRFLFECKLREEAEAKAVGGTRPDPILPAMGERSHDLRRGLRDTVGQEAYDEAMATRICNGMGEYARKLIDDLPQRASVRQQQQQQQQQQQGETASCVQVWKGSRGGGVLTLSAMGAEHTLSRLHYDKFEHLYRKHNNTAGDHDESMFLARLFVLLQRYACLGNSGSSSVSIGTSDGSGKGGNGSGFHAAVVDRVFFFLRDRLQVTMECFASPFNCHFGAFCSAFGDTDCWFGSVGSFFDFHPTQGSFEWNPPFLEDLMEAGVNQLRTLLADKQNGPLSFVIVLPNWVDPPTPSIEMLAGEPFAPFRRADIVQPKGNDLWLDGFQHNGTEQKYFVAPWEGRLFIVQNDAGAAKWPATASLIADLKRTFRAPQQSQHHHSGNTKYSSNSSHSSPRAGKHSWRK